MPSLAELVSEETIEQLLPKAEESLLIIADRREKDGTSDTMRYVLPLNEADAEEIGEPIIRLVHTYMWTHAKPHGLPSPFERKWFGYITDIARHFEFNRVMTKDQLRSWSGDMARLLRKNNLAVRITNGKSKEWAIAPWPTGLSLSVHGRWDKRKIDWKTEQSIQREAKKAKPVVVDFDPTVIPLPDPNPESVMAYVEKLYRMYDKLHAKYSETIKDLATKNRELEEMREAVKRLSEADEWGAVTQRFAQLRESVKKG